MLYPEQIEGSGSESKQRKKRSKDAREFQSGTIIHEQADGCMKQKALEILNKMGNVMGSYNDRTLTIDETAKKFLELIKVGKEQKVMFSMPCGTSIHGEKEELSIINYLIRMLYHLRVNDTNVNEDGKRQLGTPWSEISNLVLTGNHVYGEASTLLSSDILEERDNYLSRLKQVVCNSIEKGKKEDVAVERDNRFFCVECPEESVITPAKFLSDPEFENLDGALKIGDGIIRTKNGQYCDIKGKLKMTFKVDNGENIEMILSSENPLGFGKIMVNMDDKSREIFSKHCEELKKEPRIS
ncbi:MAG: hypothetical protein LKM45_00415, partial [Wolbachia endosymbiont of Alcedoecus sp.]|nr:hypothetical protein [Wolbachia endosymbiont of Alcedoecus sp.]